MVFRYSTWGWVAAIVGVAGLIYWAHAARGEATESAVRLFRPLPIVPYYAPPKEMTLCGATVPLQDPDVMERFDRELTIVVYNHAQVYLWMKRAPKYFPLIDRRLKEKGLPEDLKYLAVAESDLMHTAVSPAGAAGPWQFISSTGARYGLAQSDSIDERYDFEMATQSAFMYLKDLYGMFHDWPLAMAAYNCGEKRVRTELDRQKAQDYFTLKLPLETERYIFRILAIKEVLTHPLLYGYSLPEGSGYSPVPVTETASVTLPYATPVQALAQSAEMTYRQFKLMNPSFTSHTVPAGARRIKVPQGKAQGFTERVEAMKESFKPTKVEHRVLNGETLSSIAQKYSVDVDDLRSWNSITGDKVLVGQTLTVCKIPGG